ncbi:hypothetical protein SAMN03159368_3501 [Enterobacter hormaechei]|nr:hypothetical protein SAMN03159368_3501 [Enterobacter hormaechei]
MAGFFAF